MRFAYRYLKGVPDPENLGKNGTLVFQSFLRVSTQNVNEFFIKDPTNDLMITELIVLVNKFHKNMLVCVNMEV